MDPLEGGDISIEHFLQDQQDFFRNSFQPIFRDSTVLLTGATGPLGSLVLEKLLRSCNEVAKVYVTVRGKGVHTAYQRLKELLSTKMFDRVRLEQTEALNKVELLDMDLGLESHLDRVTSSVTMIIHCALVTDARHTMREAVDANIKHTAALMQMAYSCRKLEAFVVVTSTMCHFQERIVEERFYPPPVTAKAMCIMCDTLSEKFVNTHTSGLIVANTSASMITLNITEDMIRQGRKTLPLAIVRPSMLVASYKEPLAGWMLQNPRGVMKLLTYSMQGKLCSLRTDGDLTAELMPVDLAASLVVAVSAHTASTSRNWQNIEIEEPQDPGKIVTDSDIPIYNLVSSNHSPLSWKEFFICSLRHARNFPFTDTVWFPHLILTKSKFWFSLWFYLLHLLPALAIDSYITFTENPNILNAKRSRLYQKCLALRKSCKALADYSMTAQKYKDSNTQILWRSLSPSDRAAFNFHPSHLDWEEYLHTLSRGIRLYCLADPLDTISLAVHRMKKWKLLHYGCVVMVTFISLMFVRALVKLVLF